MADKTWPAVTVMTIAESSGRVRQREYKRKTTDRPGARERREKAAEGLRWCHGCRDWLPSEKVTKNGACQPCINAEYRQAYRADGAAIRQRVHARKRGIEPVPVIGMDYLTDQFGGLCAYCPAVADTWDHVVPISTGGQTQPGNVVPACGRCNSSKKNAEVFEWLARTRRTPQADLVAVIELAILAAA